MVTNEQVKLMRQKRMQGKTQEVAAAAAGMAVRTARKWETGPLPSVVKEGRSRDWRTRPDAFEGVWETDIVPLLTNDSEGILEAKTVLEELQKRYPDQFKEGQLRTLQRRVRDWRALHGPAQNVMFEQEHPPGREGALDFTSCTGLGVTIDGVLLKHLLFVFKLSFSGWTWVELAFGETFEALLSGLQGALWKLGGVPEVVRHDNLSAATHELRRSGGRQLTNRFKDVLDHYGLVSTRIRPGESHENGVAEKGNDLVKSAVRQALIIRASRDFPSQEAYMGFVQEVLDRRLNRAQEELSLERQHLRPLPSCAIPNYTVFALKVRPSSTIRVANRVYSVHSRLRGHEVKVRQYPNVLEVHYREKLVETMIRLRGDQEALINYRHIIGSLVRKPGAFARYRYREELFPSLIFRLGYDALQRFRGERADIEYVRILHLAATTMESRVAEALERLLAEAERFGYVDVKELVRPEPILVPCVSIPAPDLSSYDSLLGGAS